MSENLRVPFEYISDYLSLISHIEVRSQKLTNARKQRVDKYFKVPVKIYFSDYIKSQCIMKLGRTVKSKSMSTASKAYLYMTGEATSNRYRNCLIDMISSFNQDMRYLYNLLDEYRKNNGLEAVDFKVGVLPTTEDKFNFIKTDTGIMFGDLTIKVELTNIEEIRTKLNKAGDTELFEIE